MFTEEQGITLSELIILEKEYEKLKYMIRNDALPEVLDYFTLQRLKKRKLFLKDKIAYLKSNLYDDILA